MKKNIAVVLNEEKAQILEPITDKEIDHIQHLLDQGQYTIKK